MNERIRKTIDEMFTDAPKTRRAMELKEEMTQNTIEKYQDLMNDGYQEEDAYQNVISSIGDVTELFGDLKDSDPLSLPEGDRKKKAKFLSISVGLYIFAGCVLLFGLIISDYTPNANLTGLLGMLLAALICIPATCMRVYAANMYPDYHRKNDSLVELYKQARYNANEERAVKVSISCIIWTVTLILYFLISFNTGAWHVTWITFLAGGCAQAIAALIFSMRNKSN